MKGMERTPVENLYLIVLLQKMSFPLLFILGGVLLRPVGHVPVAERLGWVVDSGIEDSVFEFHPPETIVLLSRSVSWPIRSRLRFI